MNSVRLHILAAVGALAALGSAAIPAHAQYLYLTGNDAVVVSGNGTIGTIGGKPVANGTTAYSDNTSPYAIVTTGASSFTLGAGGSLTAANTSDALEASSSGLSLITGGTVTASGYFSTAVYAGGNVAISGGTIIASGRSSIGLFSNGISPVPVTGGLFSATGPGSIGLAAGENSISLFSQNDTPFLITVNGVTKSLNNTSLTGSGTITGTLFNGDPLNTSFSVSGNNSAITLNIGTPPAAAPEPSQFAAFAVGLLGLGALAVKARKRQAA